MKPDIPWLDRPEIVNVSDWLTTAQFTWLFDGVLVEKAPEGPDALLKHLFQADMIETDVDDGSLWTVYVYVIPEDVGDLPDFKYLRGSHRGAEGYTLTACKVLPGDVIVCHRRSSYNPAPVRAFERIFTKADRVVTGMKSNITV